MRKILILIPFTYILNCFDLDIIHHIKWNPDDSGNFSLIVYVLLKDKTTLNLDVNKKSDKEIIDASNAYRKIENKLKKIPKNILKSYKIYEGKEEYVAYQIETQIDNFYKFQPYLKDLELPITPEFAKNKLIINFNNFFDFSKNVNSDNPKKSNTEENPIQKEENINEKIEKDETQENSEEYNEDENNPLNNEPNNEENNEEDIEKDNEEELEFDEEKNFQNRNDIILTNFRKINSKNNAQEVFTFLNTTYYLILEGKEIKSISFAKENSLETPKIVSIFKLGEKKYLIIMPIVYVFSAITQELDKKIFIEVK